MNNNTEVEIAMFCKRGPRDKRFDPNPTFSFLYYFQNELYMAVAKGNGWRYEPGDKITVNHEESRLANEAEKSLFEKQQSLEAKRKACADKQKANVAKRNARADKRKAVENKQKACKEEQKALKDKFRELEGLIEAHGEISKKAKIRLEILRQRLAGKLIREINKDLLEKFGENINISTISILYKNYKEAVRSGKLQIFIQNNFF
jgi:predicted ribosome quality control (RQC) complex YloA/Tae2 family protein